MLAFLLNIVKFSVRCHSRGEIWRCPGKNFGHVFTAYCIGWSLHGRTVSWSGRRLFRVSINKDIQTTGHSTLRSNPSRLLWFVRRAL